ncbi:MAG: hypothetical protein KAU29_08190 [Gammaproteobacteria bacterium]|nr:hypothetical protein [Gammaproteobacteria bacterium]
MEGPFYLASLTFLLMLVAIYWHRAHPFHVPVMFAVILFDIGMPFYLMMTRDWSKRLLTDGDIMSFGVWMHFGVIISLFVLYFIQVSAGLKLLKTGTDTDDSRSEHRMLAKGILLARALVITTGAMLSEPVTSA